MKDGARPRGRFRMHEWNMGAFLGSWPCLLSWRYESGIGQSRIHLCPPIADKSPINLTFSSWERSARLIRWPFENTMRKAWLIPPCIWLILVLHWRPLLGHCRQLVLSLKGGPTCYFDFTEFFWKIKGARALSIPTQVAELRCNLPSVASNLNDHISNAWYVP